MDEVNAALGASLVALAVAEIIMALFASPAPDPESALEPHEDRALRAPTGPSYALSALIAAELDEGTT